MSRLAFVYDAEEVSVRILKNDEIVVWFIGLRVTCSSYLEQPFHFSFLVVGVKVGV